MNAPPQTAKARYYAMVKRKHAKSTFARAHPGRPRNEGFGVYAERIGFGARGFMNGHPL